MTRTKLGKWMEAEQDPPDPKRKTLFWKVYGSDKNQLGVVAWSGAWRQYVFFTEDGIVMSSGCLKALAEFLDEKNAARR